MWSVCCQDVLIKNHALNKTTLPPTPLLKAVVSLLFIIQIDDNQLVLSDRVSSLSLSLSLSLSSLCGFWLNTAEEQCLCCSIGSLCVSFGGKTGPSFCTSIAWVLPKSEAVMMKVRWRYKQNPYMFFLWEPCPELTLKKMIPKSGNLSLSCLRGSVM